MSEETNGAIVGFAATESSPAAEAAKSAGTQARGNEPEKADQGKTGESAAPTPQPEPNAGKIIQSRADNMAAAAARRRAEMEAAARYDGVDELLEAVGMYGYKGASPKEIAQQLKAQKEGTTVENIQKRERETEERQKKLIDSLPEVQQARRVIIDSAVKEHLQRVKEAYPQVKAKSALELGKKFVELMATGTVDPVTAYEAQLAYEKRTVITPPPSTGSAGAGTGSPAKEYYTPEETDRLTAKDLDNPKVMERVMRSMTRWGR